MTACVVVALRELDAENVSTKRALKRHQEGTKKALLGPVFKV